MFFNSLSALGGGLLLIIDPGGDKTQMPIEWLKDSPFNDFLIPGIILFVFIGVFSLISAIAVIKKTNKYQLLIITQGLIMLCWLTVEIIIIKSFYAPLHVPYYLTGLALIILGTLIFQKTKQL